MKRFSNSAKNMGNSTGRWLGALGWKFDLQYDRTAELGGEDDTPVLCVGGNKIIACEPSTDGGAKTSLNAFRHK